MLNTVCLTKKDDDLRKEDHERFLKHCETMGVDLRGVVGSDLGTAIYSAGWSAAHARLTFARGHHATVVGMLLMTWLVALLALTILGVVCLWRTLVY